MRFALSVRQRALLLFVSASGYAAWFAGIGGRTDAAGFGEPSPPAVTFAQRPALPPVAAVIVRDPFSGRSAATAKTHRASAVAADAAPSVVVPDIDPRSQLPPTLAPAATATLVLRATIVGREPVAYVASGAAMDIVRVGDTLGERRVVTIDLRGIVFSDGTRLDLPATYEATPPPRSRPAPSGDRISLAALRRLLLPPREAPSGAAAAPPATAPQPTASAEYPTPGPLPSANLQGLPVGVNPTPNPANPTPYPDPYPYAPPPRPPH